MRVLFCLIASVLLSLSPGERWHVRVVARNNSPAAQTEKIRVRDAVLRACPEKLQALPAALPRILAAAGDIAPDAALTVRPGGNVRRAGADSGASAPSAARSLRRLLLRGAFPAFAERRLLARKRRGGGHAAFAPRRPRPDRLFPVPAVDTDAILKKRR